ncbi:hypothetical protein WG29040_23590 [Pseudomonas sp. PAMC 29040]|uniref:hypothetical protein n=1 Tax=Pseudomonas sp. PAMC 29040 TaxID=2498450 RepID=UPI000FA617B3|nr:hypothetical protein [Pseudomonas sp. PAMC 29040]RUT30924.1 hypothetical protein WG29040_23590 [Pseudomonas sp. PAMC 29040]
MSRPLNGSFDQIKIGFAQYLKRWRDGLYADYADTKAVQAFMAKPFNQAVMVASSRMVDDAEAMLVAYQKNKNGEDGKSTLFPVLLFAMDENFIGTGADWGGDQIGRTMQQIEEGGSWYGYKHVMQDRRLQMVIIASEGGSAQSLAAQLSSFIKEPSNRYFDAEYQFGQYKVSMPQALESVRVDWMEVKPDGVKNIKILVADLTLKCSIPFFDAPAAGAPNDGSDKNPPGYPAISGLELSSSHILASSTTTTSDNPQ